MLNVQASISMYISPVMGCWISQATIMDDPITSYVSSVSSGGTPMTWVGLLSIDPSTHRDWVISTKPGGGHKGFWLDFNCSGIASWGGVTGASVFLMVTGWLSPWAANSNPLE